jgi:hypothetical protein|tara:strand:+ start:74 stop:298 length:225 start_codon:yes stop_codon:yes gene_type:complete
VKYLFLPLILILTSCSFDKNSTYWNENQKIKSLENKQLSKILKKNSDLKKMTFKEFNLFLEDYSKKAEYPDINK